MDGRLRTLWGWDGQSPPSRGVPEVYKGKHLPKFGNFQLQRNELRKQEALAKDLLVAEEKKEVPPADKVPTVNEQIGKAVPRIGNYNSLNNKQQSQILQSRDFLPHSRQNSEISCTIRSLLGYGKLCVPSMYTYFAWPGPPNSLSTSSWTCCRSSTTCRSADRDSRASC